MRRQLIRSNNSLLPILPRIHYHSPSNLFFISFTMCNRSSFTNLIVYTFVTTLLLTISGCGLDNIYDENWGELSRDECINHEVTSLYIPEIEGLELIRCETTGIESFIYFNLPETLAPNDWLLFLMSQDVYENYIDISEFVKTSDYTYCNYVKRPESTCFTEYKYYEDGNYYHKYRYKSS